MSEDTAGDTTGKVPTEFDDLVLDDLVPDEVQDNGVLDELQALDRDTDSLPDAREAKMPQSTSFPSGHSASGFAFATAVGTQLPLTGAALRFLAGAVAYSRVHTGVHYPGDVVIGSLVGSSIGGVIGEIAQRRIG